MIEINRIYRANNIKSNTSAILNIIPHNNGYKLQFIDNPYGYMQSIKYNTLKECVDYINNNYNYIRVITNGD